MDLGMMCADSVRSSGQIERGQAGGTGPHRHPAHPHRGVVGVSSPGLAAAQEPPL